MKIFPGICIRVLWLVLAAGLVACDKPDSSNTTDTAQPANSEVEAAKPTVVEERVWIISPADGATVTNPVKVVFGIEGKVVAPAGQDVPNSGHHHLLIDLAELPALNLPIPNDDQHRHFGGGQTETEITLSPGQHSLQLLLGDLNHIPHDPALISEKITITVTE